MPLPPAPRLCCRAPRAKGLPSVGSKWSFHGNCREWSAGAWKDPGVHLSAPVIPKLHSFVTLTFFEHALLADVLLGPLPSPLVGRCSSGAWPPAHLPPCEFSRSSCPSPGWESHAHDSKSPSPGPPCCCIAGPLPILNLCFQGLQLLKLHMAESPHLLPPQTCVSPSP